MCGIVAYIGSKNPLPILLDGLEKLEYRGYDSAGVFLNGNSKETLVKVTDKIQTLRAALKKQSPSQATIGIGHTRWATHGSPTTSNAHPHISNSGEIVLVHNGIIENYDALKKELLKKGYQFYSETDSEVLVNLIQDVQQAAQLPIHKAVQQALDRVIGAYGLVVFDKKKAKQMIVARLGSPLVIGIDKSGFYVGSDPTPFLAYTKSAIYLKDGEMAQLGLDKKIEVRRIKNDEKLNPRREELQWNMDQIQKDGYDHYMLKEIHEQPRAIRDTLRGRMFADQGKIQISSINDFKNRFVEVKRIIIIACGTSWHAGLVGEYLIEHFARIPVEVEYASEFRYRNPVLFCDDIVIPISQSGETADTLAAVKLAKEAGSFIYGISNVVGSSIPRETHSGIYTHAGPEIGVASTKAFTTQITVLMLLALKLGELKGKLSKEERTKHLKELACVPDLIDTMMAKKDAIYAIAKKIHKSANCLYLGRGLNFPVALEGALKLKEISYIHAEGYPAAEMKHGPIALIDEAMPVVVIATKKGHYDKIVSNIQEIKARKGILIAIITQGDQTVKELADYSIEIPESSQWLTPFFATLPLQFLSYYIAILRNCNVDQPRNLAKSVTVE